MRHDTRHDGLGCVLHLGKLCNQQENLGSLRLRHIHLCTDSFSDSQLCVQNGRHLGLEASQPLAQRTDGDTEEIGHFLVGPRRIVLTTGHKHGSSHQGTARLSAGLAGILDSLEGCTGVLNDGLGKSDACTRGLNRIKDSHPGTLAMARQRPRRQLANRLGLIGLPRRPLSHHHGSVRCLGEELVDDTSRAGRVALRLSVDAPLCGFVNVAAEDRPTAATDFLSLLQLRLRMFAVHEMCKPVEQKSVFNVFKNDTCFP